MTNEIVRVVRRHPVSSTELVPLHVRGPFSRDNTRLERASHKPSDDNGRALNNLRSMLNLSLSKECPIPSSHVVLQLDRAPGLC